MGEIKQANFRIDSDTADAFRAFCEQKGMNQAQGFDHVMQVFELNKPNPQSRGEVSRLRSLKPWLSPSPPHICIAWN